MKVVVFDITLVPFFVLWHYIISYYHLQVVKTWLWRRYTAWRDNPEQIYQSSDEVDDRAVQEERENRLRGMNEIMQRNQGLRRQQQAVQRQQRREDMAQMRVNLLKTQTERFTQEKMQ